MKKYFLILILLITTPLVTMAERPRSFDELFKKAENREGVTMVVIGKDLLKTMPSEAFKDIDRIRSITLTEYSAEFEKDCEKIGVGLDLIASMSQDKNKVRIYGWNHHHYRNGIKSVLLIIVIGEDNAVVYIEGAINLEKMSGMKIGGINIWE